MAKSTRIVLGVVAILAVVLVILLIDGQRQPSDEEIINQRLQSMENAAQNDNVSAFMRSVSSDYSDSQVNNTDQLALLLHRVLPSGGNLRITLQDAETTVDGPHATTHVVVLIQSTDERNITQRSVTVTWRREQAHKWLVFPIKTWRVTSAQYGSSIDPYLGSVPS